jgi:hypothetical protein
MMSAAPPAGAAAALRGRAERPDYQPLLARLDIPALVCTGSEDPWSNRAVTAQIVACLKRPELLVIDGTGHLPNLEAENEFNDALNAFLLQRAHQPDRLGEAAGWLRRAPRTRTRCRIRSPICASAPVTTNPRRRSRGARCREDPHTGRC